MWPRCVSRPLRRRRALRGRSGLPVALAPGCRWSGFDLPVGAVVARLVFVGRRPAVQEGGTRLQGVGQEPEELCRPGRPECAVEVSRPDAPLVRILLRRPRAVIDEGDAPSLGRAIGTHRCRFTAGSSSSRRSASMLRSATPTRISCLIAMSYRPLRRCPDGRNVPAGRGNEPGSATVRARRRSPAPAPRTWPRRRPRTPRRTSSGSRRSSVTCAGRGTARSQRSAWPARPPPGRPGRGAA